MAIIVKDIRKIGGCSLCGSDMLRVAANASSTSAAIYDEVVVAVAVGPCGDPANVLYGNGREELPETGHDGF